MPKEPETAAVIDARLNVAEQSASTAKPPRALPSLDLKTIKNVQTSPNGEASQEPSSDECPATPTNLADPAAQPCSGCTTPTSARSADSLSCEVISPLYLLLLLALNCRDLPALCPAWILPL